MKALLRGIFFCGALISTSVSYAAIINTANDSFIDDATGLEWIDFNVTTNQSFNSVVANLSTTYNGWRLPTYEEVKVMWSGIFDQPGYGWKQVGTSEDYLTDSISGNSPWFNLGDIMGYSIVNADSTKWNITGLFDTGASQLGNVSAVACLYNACYGANAQLHYTGNSWQHKRNTALSFQSTLLVKKDVSVPEASSIYLLVFGLLGMFGAARRKV